MYLAETEFTLLVYALLVLYDTRVAFPLAPTPASTAAASPSGSTRPRRVQWLTHSAIIPAATLADASAVAAAEAAALGHPAKAADAAAEATGVAAASCTAAAAASLAGVPTAMATGEQQQLPRWKLRLRADMFSAFDGVVPFTVSPRWR
jgi:hypothetical protein